MAQTIGSVIIDVKADTQALVTGFDRAEKKVNQTTKNMKRAMAGLAASYLSIQGINAFSSMIKGSIDAADSVGKLAEKLAISAESLSKLQYAAGYADVSINQLNASMSAMIRRTGNFKKDGTGAAKKAMEELGISVNFARENFTDTETTFKLLIDRLSQVDDAMLRTKIAQDLFSKSAANVVRLASMGTKELERLGAEGKKLGAVITDDMAAKSAILNDQITKLDQSLLGVKNEIAMGFIPTLSNMYTEIEKNKDGIVTFALDIGRAFDIAGIVVAKTVVDIQKAGAKIDLFNAKIENAFTFGNNEEAVANIKKFENEIDLLTTQQELLSKQFNDTWNSFGTLGKKEAATVSEEVGKFNEAYFKSINTIKEVKKETTDFTNSFEKSLKILNQSNEIVTNYYAQLNDSQNEARQALEAYHDSLNSTYVSYINIVGSDYEQWLVNTNEKMKALAASGALTAEELQKAYDVMSQEQERKTEKKQLETDTTNIEDSMEPMQELLEMQIELAESGNDWSSSLDGVAGSLAGVVEAFSKMDVSGMQFDKSSLKLQEDYAKEFLEAGGDIQKQKEAELKFDKKNEKLKKKYADKEIDNYANMAKASASLFNEKTGAYQALHAIEIAMHAAKMGMFITETAAELATVAPHVAAEGTKSTASGITAVISSMAGLPFPYNLIAFGITSAVVVAALAGSIGGGGSGGGGGSSKSTYEVNKENIEAEYSPILDKFDRQIDLLESIDRNGSASALGVDLAALEFEKSYKLYVEDELESFSNYIDFRVFERQGLKQDDYIKELAKINESFNNALFSVTQTKASGAILTVDETGLQGSGTQIRTDKDVLREGYNLIKYFGLIVESQYGQIQALGDAAGNWGEKMHTAGLDYQTSLSTYYDLISEYAGSLIDINNDLKDASDTMKESFDAITGTAKYELENLKKAFADFDRIRGKDAPETLFSKQISEYSYADYLERQIEAIESVNAELDGGLIDLLLLEDPRKIQEQRLALESLGESMGVVFDDGARGALDYIESIELVAEAMETSRENIKDFKDSFKTEQQLAEDLADAVGVTLATTQDGLVDLFANLSKGLGGLTDSELELLEANKDLIESDLDEYIESITDNISTLEKVADSLTSTINKLREEATDSEYSLQQYYTAMSKAQGMQDSKDYEAVAEAIDDAISKSSVLSDESLFEYSRDQKFAQLVAANQFEEMQVTAMTEIDYLKQIEENTKGTWEAVLAQLTELGKDIKSLKPQQKEAYFTSPTTKETFSQQIIKDYTTATINAGNVTDVYMKAKQVGMTSSELDTAMGWETGLSNKWAKENSLPAFANGGIITAPTVGLIGEAGYNEAVIPLKDPSDPLQMNQVNSAIMSLKDEVRNLGQKLDQQTKIASETRDNTVASVEQLETLVKVS